MAEDNPFFHRGPIRDPNYFFGRSPELKHVRELLLHGQHLSISGPRRFGKTSLLFHLVNESAAEPSEWVYLDGGMLDGMEDEWLYGAVNRACGGDEDAIAYNDFVELVRRVTEEKSRLIIALDEFELLAANPHLGVVVFNRLRGLTNQFPIQFITTSRRPLAELSFAHSDTLSSPFFNIFAPMYLSAFSEPEAIQMLSALSERTNQRFSDATIRFIIDLVGCHPLFLQVAGYYSFVDQQDGSLSLDARDNIRARVLTDLDGHLQYYWNSLDDDARYALATLPFFNNGTPTPVVQALQQSGFQPNGERFSGIVREFVRYQTVPDVLHVGPFVIDKQRGLAAVNNQLIHLTGTEFAALTLFLENPGRLISPEEIESSLWPDEAAIDPERARGVIKKLRAALGTAGEMIVNRRGQGYLLILD